MVSLGLIDAWKPLPGRVTTWNATADARAEAMRAPVDPTPPSYQQRNCITATRARETAAFVGAKPDRHSQLCVVAWDIPGQCDIAAMTTAVNGYLRRHDTHTSWFDVGDDGSIVRRTMTDPNEIDVAPRSYGHIDSAKGFRDHLDKTTPHLFAWDTWSYGIIQRADHFTFYVCEDHINTDAMSAPVILLEIQQLYAAAVAGTPAALAAPGSYLKFCEQEQSFSKTLTKDSTEVAHWLRFLVENKGDLPHFPLPLGTEAGPSACNVVSIDLLDAEQSELFEAACRAGGARFTGGVFACSALAEQLINGADTHFTLTPCGGRATPEEYMTVGWLASLVPIQVPLNPGASFSDIAGEAQKSFDHGKSMGRVSVHCALDLVTPEMGIVTKPGFSAPMVSFIDVRKMPLSEVFDQVNACLFGYSRLIDEVFFWVNRFDTGTSVSVMHPDNPTANASVAHYLEVLRDVYAAAARSGELVSVG